MFVNKKLNEHQRVTMVCFQLESKKFDYNVDSKNLAKYTLSILLTYLIYKTQQGSRLGNDQSGHDT